MLAPLRRLSAGSRLAICEMRLLFCTAGIIVGISGSSSSALGEVEVPASQDVSISDYDQTNNSLRGAIVNLLDIAYGNNSRLFHSNHSSFDAIYNDNAFLHYNTNTTTGRSDPFGSPENLGDVIIPAAVWSLDVNTGVRLDQIPSDLSFNFGMVVGSRGGTRDFWTRLTVGFWADMNTDRLSSPLQFKSRVVAVPRLRLLIYLFVVFPV